MGPRGRPGVGGRVPLGYGHRGARGRALGRARHHDPPPSRRARSSSPLSASTWLRADDARPARPATAPARQADREMSRPPSRHGPAAAYRRRRIKAPSSQALRDQLTAVQRRARAGARRARGRAAGEHRVGEHDGGRQRRAGGRRRTAETRRSAACEAAIEARDDAARLGDRAAARARPRTPAREHLAAERDARQGDRAPNQRESSSGLRLRSGEVDPRARGGNRGSRPCARRARRARSERVEAGAGARRGDRLARAPRS